MNELSLASKVAWSFHGTFYSWGGDDPDAFDCSGYVMEILQSVGIVGSGDLSADGLYHKLFSLYGKLPDTLTPCEGCIAFKFDQTGKAIHVGYMASNFFVLHAAGGGSHIKTKEDAIKANAFIKLRPVWGNAVFINPFFG
jgi:cell wall-associated NlpC family hydrolase